MEEVSCLPPPLPTLINSFQKKQEVQDMDKTKLEHINDAELQQAVSDALTYIESYVDLGTELLEQYIIELRGTRSYTIYKTFKNKRYLGNVVFKGTEKELVQWCNEKIQAGINRILEEDKQK